MEQLPPVLPAVQKKVLQETQPIAGTFFRSCRLFLTILFLANELLWFSYRIKKIFLIEKIQRIFIF